MLFGGNDGVKFNVKYAHAYTELVANAASAIESAVLDRDVDGEGGIYESLTHILAYENLAFSAGQTLSVAVTYKDSDNGTDFLDAAVAVGTVALDKDSDEEGAVKLLADLSGAKKYIKLILTPTWKTSNTDAINFSSVAAFGNGGVIPA